MPNNMSEIRQGGEGMQSDHSVGGLMMSARVGSASLVRVTSYTLLHSQQYPAVMKCDCWTLYKYTFRKKVAGAYQDLMCINVGSRLSTLEG